MAKAPVVINTVVMEDGRSVDFAGTRNMIRTDVGEDQVRFDFSNGTTRLVDTSIGGLTAKLAQHGLRQKIGDEIAGVKDIEDAVCAVDDLLDRLGKGNFNQVKAGASGLAGAGILVRALAESTGKDAATIRAWLAGKTPAEKAALRGSGKLAPIVARLEAEKAAKAAASGKTTASKPVVDTQALLEELG